MRKLHLILGIFMFAQFGNAQQNDSFTQLWEQVEKLEKENLSKSALKLVETISQKAKKEKNTNQTIKSLLYRSKYNLILDKDAELNIIKEFNSEITTAKNETSNILHSYLANIYWQYFQQNRFRFYTRTTTETKVDSADFRTWDLATLFKEIDTHFQASLKHPKKLQKLPISQFGDLLHIQENSAAYRPTLFDLLAHSALSYYTTSENSIQKPLEAFKIDNENVLCEAYSFSTLDIFPKENGSLQAKALKIYQQLVSFHFGNPNLKALVEVDIERLLYIHEFATFANKEELLIEVLKNSAESIKTSPYAALYTYEIANLYQKLGASYNPKTKNEPQWKLKEAVALCDQVIAAFPKSRGAEKCKALKSQIQEPFIQLQIEENIANNTIARLLVTYKNSNNVQLTAYKISQNKLKELNQLYPETKKRSYIQRLPEETTWSSTLKTENDLQSHTTEISMPALTNGHYVIVAGPKDKSESFFSYATVQITDFAISETQTDTHQIYRVFNRTHGKPIVGAKVTLNYRKSYNSPAHRETFTTNAFGTISIKKNENSSNSIDITVKKNSETAFFNEFYISRNYVQNQNTVANTCFLFTDRSIYRPGQPLYFKGIAVQQEDGKSTILKNTLVQIQLFNVNGQGLQSQQFTTNEFGSFSGEFILPNTGLTGSYYLQVNADDIDINGYSAFSVEEYKRPKFETSFNQVTESYKVNDSVTIHGTAKAFAGSAVTNAKVKYRVKRIVNLPRWYYWSRPYFNSAPQEITQGETITDASGKYELIFKALPDTSIDKKNLPTFTYEITADVTDVNGETQSTTTNVYVGYHTLNVHLSLPEVINKQNKDAKINILSTNLNGATVASTGVIKLYKLQGPDNVLRPRTWPAPDYAGFTEQEFKRLYPHDAYKDEDKPMHWKKGKTVWKSSFDTGKTTELSLGKIKNWDSGKYRMELTAQDKFGQEVKDVAMLTLTGDETKLADNQLFRVKTDKESYTVGDNAKITFLSNAKNLNIFVRIEKNHTTVDSLYVNLRGNSKTITVPVTQQDLGGFAINYSYTFYNSFKAHSLPIQVPYPERDLEIETLTFRDKIAPGEKETWSFKVKGPKGDKVTAELLASMYDASLNQFAYHNWHFNPLMRPIYYSSYRTNAQNSFSNTNFRTHQVYENYRVKELVFDSYNWFGFYFGAYRNNVHTRTQKMKRSSAPMAFDTLEENAALEEVVITGYSEMENDNALQGAVKGVNVTPTTGSTKEKKDIEVAIRKNLQETAFFFPQLKTDKEGNVSFSFTSPEALTRWNVQLLAHTKELESSITKLNTVTQKELMVIPNAPRFLREGDTITISTKISNLTQHLLSGQAKLELTDGLTGTDISKELMESSDILKAKSFEVDSMGNTQVSWRLNIPEGLQNVQYKVIAKAGDFSDGEQNMLPVLSNRTLVTETLPMWVRSNQTKTFTLDKLKNTNSVSLKHHKLTLEMTSNPAWYAVQALPYLMEYPYDCNEQTFSRYYANSLASYIANSNPRIQEVFDQWASSNALLSNLEKNEELKSLLIQETPWLGDAQSESEQKKRIGLLFNMNKMKNEQQSALNKLIQNQNSNGAWAWFNGGPDNRYITQHIVTGMGHLNKLTTSEDTNIDNLSISFNSTSEMIKKAIDYLDNEFVKEYEEMKKYTSNINDDHLSANQVHYLYMRSFFKNIETSKKVDKIIAYYIEQAQKYWTKRGLYAQGMLALTLQRMDDTKTASKIIQAIEENSITSNELGMYWKSNTSSWFWYQAPIETQALLIEAFSEIRPTDIETIDKLKIWLLKNKQTNQWSTTKATTEAVFALLLQGSDWLSVTDAVDVLIGGEQLKPSTLEDVKVEAGTGYFKTSWNTAEVTPKMGEVQISKKGNGIAWGALYWQYFEDLDNITSAETPLQLKKKIFLKKNTDTGEVISEVTDNTTLKVGDLVKIRIELRSDRDMEFIHMKDMRAAGFEPVNVISRYKWQDGLGYYESTKDASTNFFFDYLPKGIYVFEYDVRVNNAGNFSNGITTIESMYAPEFTSHSEGVRVSVEN